MNIYENLDYIEEYIDSLVTNDYYRDSSIDFREVQIRIQDLREEYAAMEDRCERK